MVRKIGFISFSGLMLLTGIFSCTKDDMTDDDLTEENSFRGEIISSTLLAHYTTAETSALLSAIDPGLLAYPIDYEIEIYKVIYKTITADDIETQASGAVIIPVASTDSFPLISYQHGTVLLKESVPSRQNDDIYLGIIYACGGYVMAMPDYLGLGDSPGMHPYCQSKTEASATIDLLLAAKTLCSDKTVGLNGQLFLFGYSQGGHATMSAVKEIQLNYKDEFEITSAAPMSGPYDLSGAQKEMLLTDDPYNAPYYLPYLLFAYNEIYDLWDSPSDYFVSPYDETLPPLFDGTHESEEINDAMPDVPKTILQPDILDLLVNNTPCPLVKALQGNDLIDWKPNTPMTMYYCSGDDLVTSMNTTNAFDSFILNGSVTVTTMDANPFAGHLDCTEPCVVLTRAGFDALKN
ncbi:MAG: alpha/beta hydrolase family protein [Chitinophagales bacterium]